MPQGLSERNALAGAGKHFLVNKYYLDFLYTDIIVGGIKGPIASGVVLGQPERHRQRAELRRQGRARRSAGSPTTYIDQRGVDGVVNGIATVTGEPAARSASVQTGRLQFYALMLVVAVGLFAVVALDLHVSGGESSR